MIEISKNTKKQEDWKPLMNFETGDVLEGKDDTMKEFIKGVLYVKVSEYCWVLVRVENCVKDYSTAKLTPIGINSINTITYKMMFRKVGTAKLVLSF